MKTIEVILLEERVELEKIINDTQKRLKKAPQGHIRITEKNGKPHFYYKGEKMGKGERVRSKSEKIIADKLYMLGIPYR